MLRENTIQQEKHVSDCNTCATVQSTPCKRVMLLKVRYIFQILYNYEYTDTKSMYLIPTEKYAGRVHVSVREIRPVNIPLRKTVSIINSNTVQDFSIYTNKASSVL